MSEGGRPERLCAAAARGRDQMAKPNYWGDFRERGKVPMIASQSGEETPKP
jgi:hypothetical protein